MSENSFLIQAQYMRGMGLDSVFLSGKDYIGEAQMQARKNLPKHEQLELLRQSMGECAKCKLSTTRNKLVFGKGSAEADLMIVGEAPGRDEDLQGEPFVGRAGKLLTNILAAIDLSRDDVFIGNVIKCRPPANRNPEHDEIAACRGFLFEQINIIQPKAILTLGSFAAQLLLDTDDKISSLRGKFHDFKGIPVMPTYHPAYLLRNPSAKKYVWEDVQIVRDHLKECLKG